MKLNTSPEIWKNGVEKDRRFILQEYWRSKKIAELDNGVDEGIEKVENLNNLFQDGGAAGEMLEKRIKEVHRTKPTKTREISIKY